MNITVSLNAHTRTHTNTPSKHTLRGSETLDYPVPHIDILLLRLLPDVTMRCKTKAKGGMVSRACDSALSDTLTRARLEMQETSDSVLSVPRMCCVSLGLR